MTIAAGMKERARVPAGCRQSNAVRPPAKQGRKRSCSSKKLGRDDDSKRRHHAGRPGAPLIPTRASLMLKASAGFAAASGRRVTKTRRLSLATLSVSRVGRRTPGRRHQLRRSSPVSTCLAGRNRSARVRLSRFFAGPAEASPGGRTCAGRATRRDRSTDIGATSSKRAVLSGLDRERINEPGLHW